LVAVLVACPLAAADQPDAWSHLAAVRDGLAAASPLAADFVQSFTPNGFSVADEESGVMAMRLLAGAGDADAECVRWDYAEPFPKGFLLCGRVAWAWNPGEESGRRQLLARADEFGLDLLRLSIDQLRQSYDAEIGERSGSRIEVRLEPISESAAAEIRDASIELDSDSRRLLSLSYHDVEGNLTRFALGDYRAVDDPVRLFAPPSGLDWLDE
jgi:hypothetical protein